MSASTLAPPIAQTEKPRPDRVGAISYDQFLATYEGGGAEWVAGKVFPTMPASELHQDIVDFLTAVLRAFVEFYSRGRVISAPFQMKCAPDSPGREPDIIFVASENLGRIKNAFLDGPADLAVEVISPESQGRDRGDKFYEYQAGGVREYWIIDPERQVAEFYRLNDRGLFEMEPAAEGRYASLAVDGFSLPLPWLWDRPSLVKVMKELSLV